MSCAEWSDDVSAFYRSPAVQGHIAEYCGGATESPETFTCSRIAAFGGRDRLAEAEGAPVAHDKRSWGRLLADGVDLCRALADRRGTLIHLDVDYVDPQEPGAPYRRPDETFARLEPVYRVLRQLFAQYGVPNRALVTGRGYHLTTRVPFGSPFQAGLVGISRLSDSL